MYCMEQNRANRVKNSRSELKQSPDARCPVNSRRKFAGSLLRYWVPCYLAINGSLSQLLFSLTQASVAAFTHPSLQNHPTISQYPFWTERKQVRLTAQSKDYQYIDALRLKTSASATVLFASHHPPVVIVIGTSERNGVLRVQYLLLSANAQQA